MRQGGQARRAVYGDSAYARADTWVVQATTRVCHAMYDVLLCLHSNYSCGPAWRPLMLFPYRWTEPPILWLVVLYTVLLTIQAQCTLTLCGPAATLPHILNYFQSWEDCIIFGLFIFFINVPFLLPSLLCTDTSPTLGLALEAETLLATSWNGQAGGSAPIGQDRRHGCSHYSSPVTILRADLFIWLFDY
jgi:hypothetical protein